MRTRFVLAWGLLAATVAVAQEPVISSFRGNGSLVWTNVPNTNALYRVEWAASAGGPWYRTLQAIQGMDGRTGATFSVQVPMFYRVVMATNPPPAGMVLIDGGDVVLGGEGVDVRTNFISAFYMEEMEVSRGLWDRVVSWALTNGYNFSYPTGWYGTNQTPRQPVVGVNWFDCARWCNARSEFEGLTPCYCTGPAKDVVYRTGHENILNGWVRWDANGYRLPTVAEWEKAARGGRLGRLFPSGKDTISHADANYHSLFGGVGAAAYDKGPEYGYHPAYTNQTGPYCSPAGSFPANPLGLHDMDGNAVEWCWDWYGPVSPDYAQDPRGPDTASSSRLYHGAGWLNTHSAVHAQCHVFGYVDPGYTWADFGFRTVRKP